MRRGGGRFALFKLAGTKSEETRVAVGEALCFAFGGVGVTAEGALFGSFASLAELTEKTSVERMSSASKAAEPRRRDRPGTGLRGNRRDSR